jgi:putative transposase
MRNLLVRVPRHAQPMVASLVRTIFAQERAEDAWAQLERVVAQLQQGRFVDAAALLADAATDILAYTTFPRRAGGRCGLTIRRSGSTGRSAGAPRWSASSPDRASVIRLVGAVLAEQHDEMLLCSVKPAKRSARAALADTAGGPGSASVP